jgi:hypothetical protein
MKIIPVWAMALLKDAIARLKEADARLCSAILREHDLQEQVGTSLHHGAQFAAYLSALIRLGTIDDDGIKLFPLQGVVIRCEGVLMQRAEYLQLILDAFVKSGLVKSVHDKKYGASINDPKAAVLEDFSVFCRQVASSGKEKFVPIKFVPWMSALGRIKKKSPEKEFWTQTELATAFDKDLGRTDSNAVIANLQNFGVVRLKPGSEDAFSFDANQAQRRVVFEGACRELISLKEQAAKNDKKT